VGPDLPGLSLPGATLAGAGLTAPGLMPEHAVLFRAKAELSATSARRGAADMLAP
jgi:hypothetical protein